MDTAHLLARVRARPRGGHRPRRGHHPRPLAARLLRDAEDPVDVDLDRYPVERRKRAMYGLPDMAPARSGCWSSPTG